DPAGTAAGPPLKPPRIDAVYHSRPTARARAARADQEPTVSEHVIHATDADFDATVLQSKEPVLVDFWAPWCGPCKAIAPLVDELAEEYAGRARVVKVDIDQNPATALRYHVRSI